MVIKHLETKDQELRNITLNGFSVKAMLKGEAASTLLDWSKCTIKVILNRQGNTHVIIQDNLQLIGLASTIDQLTQSAFGTSTAFSTKLAAAQFMVSFIIPFGGHINLVGDDTLYIEVKNDEGLFTDADLIATSFLEIKPLKSRGVETFVPNIRTKVIQANETTNQYMIGDNVIRLAILNLDKTSFESPVIRNLTMASTGANGLDQMLTYEDLVQSKLERFGRQLIPAGAELAAQILEDQSFIINDFGNEELDGLSLDIQFNGDNVAASKNYIVVWTYETNWGIIEKANDKLAINNAAKSAKVDAMSGKK
jgi:hypothetical protein